METKASARPDRERRRCPRRLSLRLLTHHGKGSDDSLPSSATQSSACRTCPRVGSRRFHVRRAGSGLARRGPTMHTVTGRRRIRSGTGRNSVRDHPGPASPPKQVDGNAGQLTRRRGRAAWRRCRTWGTRCERGASPCSGRRSPTSAQLVFHCERRLRVLERDILRLGTAHGGSFSRVCGALWEPNWRSLSLRSSPRAFLPASSSRAPGPTTEGRPRGDRAGCPDPAAPRTPDRSRRSPGSTTVPAASASTTASRSGSSISMVSSTHLGSGFGIVGSSLELDDRPARICGRVAIHLLERDRSPTTTPDQGTASTPRSPRRQRSRKPRCLPPPTRA